MSGPAPQLEALIQTAEKTRELLPHIQAVQNVITNCFSNGGKLLACGNGGSACDAAHLAEELTGKYLAPRRALPAVNLAADAAALTCIANDWSFDHVFARQVEALGRPGDVLVAFSTSGNSPNILNALRTANQLGLATVALLGKDGGAAASIAAHPVIVPSSESARIQEIHTWILHVILDAVEAMPSLHQAP